MDLLKIDSFITYEIVEHVSIVSHISLSVIGLSECKSK